MKIKLMSIKEYEKYEDVIPHSNLTWWLRSASRSEFVSCVEYDGLEEDGFHVCQNQGVRPIIKCEDYDNVFCYNDFGEYESMCVNIGDTIIINSFPFVCIDKNLYIAKESIFYDMFDDESEEYKHSYIKKRLKKWLKTGE